MKWMHTLIRRRPRCITCTELHMAMHGKLKDCTESIFQPDAFLIQGHYNDCERISFTSCMLVTGRSRSVRTPSVTDDILDSISEMPESSTRELHKAMNISRNTVWQILRDEGMQPYNAQRVQGLELADYQALDNFTTWFL